MGRKGEKGNFVISAEIIKFDYLVAKSYYYENPKIS